MNKKIGTADIYRSFDNTFHLISEILLSAIKRLAPYATAVLPGTLFGFTIYAFFLSFTGIEWIAIVVGLSAFVVLESAGIWSGHKIAEFYGDGTKRIRIPIISFSLYLIIGIGTLWFLDSEVNVNVKIIGTSLFLLAGVVYTLFGFQSYQERMENKDRRKEKEEKQEVIDAEWREFELEEKRKDLELERKLKIKQANAEAKLLLSGATETVTEKKRPSGGYNQAKMKKLKIQLNLNPNLSKVELAEKVGVSRPTLDKYLQIIEDEKK